MKAGETFLLRNQGASLDSHLWIILSDPSRDPDRLVIVNMTSYRDDKDKACILDRGDHPYISHRTCINYKKARKIREQDLDGWLKTNLAEAKAPCSPKLLQKIRDGVAVSWMPLDLAGILEEQGLIEL